MFKIKILSMAVQIRWIHRIMFANREIFENYCNLRLVTPAACGRLVLCMPATEINCIRESWLRLFK